jgi:hypothetical protein
MLAARLAEVGVTTDRHDIANKITGGALGVDFLLRCMHVMGATIEPVDGCSAQRARAWAG